MICCLLLAAALRASAAVIYVDNSASGVNNGTSWIDACTNLQSGLSLAASNDEIWVAAGTYVPGTNPTNSFQLKPWVSLYGGFARVETNRNQRSWTGNSTVLSGDLLGNDAGGTNLADNAYHVVRGIQNATLDGFLVRGGNAAGAGLDACGGALLITNGVPVVRNCTFAANNAANCGGAVYIQQASPVLVNCLFTANQAVTNGGAIDCKAGSQGVLQGCFLAGNRASSGGALYNDSGSLMISNCLICGNQAGLGGAIYNCFSARLQLQSCTLADNSTGSSGNGGAIYNYWLATAALTNSILWGDAAAPGGGAECYNNTSTNTVGFSVVFGGVNGTAVGSYAGTNLDLGGNLTNNPLFVAGATGTWSASAAYVPSGGQSVLTDTTAAWVPGAWSGKYVQPNTNLALSYPVISNSATALYLWGDFSTNGFSGKRYQMRDYHLKSTAGHWETGLQAWVVDATNSPCLDAGNPASAVNNEPLPNGGRIDIGCYGNTAEASKSPMKVSSLGVSGVQTNLVTCSALISSVGAGTNAELYFCYGHAEASAAGLGGWDHAQDLGSWSNGSTVVSNVLLASDTAYYGRFFVTNSFGAAWSGTTDLFSSGMVTVQATLPAAQEETATPGAFTIFRSQNTTNIALVVNYGMSGTASNGVDYLPLGGSATIPAGSTGVVVSIIPVNDYGADGVEVAQLTLLAGSYVVGSPATASVSISDWSSLAVVDNGAGATGLQLTSATLNGTLLATGSSATVVGFCWGLADGNTNWASWSSSVSCGQQAPGAFSTSLSGLQMHARYYYRSWGSNQAGLVWSPATTNLDLPFVPAAVDNGAGAVQISYHGASLSGTLLSTGSTAVAAVGFAWGTADGSTNAATWQMFSWLGSGGPGAFATNLTGLASNTLYYYRAVASNVVGMAWAPATANFTTGSGQPTLYVQTGATGHLNGATWTDAFASIQAAINVAESNDVIRIGAGAYYESLVISNQTLTLLGTGTNNCLLCGVSDGVPILSIQGPGRVELDSLALVGVTNALWDTSIRYGILAGNNINLALNQASISRVRNYMLWITGGSLAATGLALNAFPPVQQCDVGLELAGCVARISNFTHASSFIDHTIDVNSPLGMFSDVVVDTASIQASNLSWGDCVRSYSRATLIVTNCYFYRIPGEQAAPYPTHTGFSENGFSNTVLITGCSMNGVPYGIQIYGSIQNSNHIRVENTQIRNCENAGVIISGVNYEGLDLGGGHLGSRGGNSFSHTNPPAGYYDVIFASNAVLSCSNIFAIGNTWTGGTGTNKEVYIWDRLDDPNMGRLVTESNRLDQVTVATNGNLILRWTERGMGELYQVEQCTNLAQGVWTSLVANLVNSSLTADMSWTNTGATLPAAFYRVRATAP